MPSRATPSSPDRPTNKRYWSAEVMRKSDALDLDQGVFKLRSAKRIAESLKHSAEVSQRRKASPFQSAMSMLNFYLNRAGRNLSDSRRAILERAKIELRKLYGRNPGGTTHRTAR